MSQMIERVPFVGRRLVNKVRFIAGFGIAFVGASVILADTIRFVSASL